MKKSAVTNVRMISLIISSLLIIICTACSQTENDLNDSKMSQITEGKYREDDSSFSETAAKPVSDSSLPETAEKEVSGVPEQQEADNAAYTTDAQTLEIVKSYVSKEPVIEYADFTVDEFLESVEAVYHMAHDNGFTYGNSRTLPPCEDGVISCDRLIARALWDLGMTDQPEGGMAIGSEIEYLTSHGFELVTEQKDLQRGDVVIQDNGVGGIPNWKWHTFVLVSYDKETTLCEKYDCGHFTPEGADRISSEQPFSCYLADYKEQRRFVCGFHLKSNYDEGQSDEHERTDESD